MTISSRKVGEIENNKRQLFVKLTLPKNMKTATQAPDLSERPLSGDFVRSAPSFQ
jgi:hypothetical protein